MGSDRSVRPLVAPLAPGGGTRFAPVGEPSLLLVRRRERSVERRTLGSSPEPSVGSRAHRSPVTPWRCGAGTDGSRPGRCTARPRRSWLAWGPGTRTSWSDEGVLRILGCDPCRPRCAADLHERTDAVRVVFAESDGLPGVVADRYDSHVVVQLSSAGADRWRPAIAVALARPPGGGRACSSGPTSMSGPARGLRRGPVRWSATCRQPP